MTSRDEPIELHVLDWHSFHSEQDGDEYVLYIQKGLQPSSYDPARAVRITGATADEAYANAVRYAREMQGSSNEAEAE